MPKYKIRSKKAICTVIRKTIVLKRRKFNNTFNEHFERPVIIHCIIHTVHTVLAGVNLVISEAAC